MTVDCSELGFGQKRDLSRTLSPTYWKGSIIRFELNLGQPRGIANLGFVADWLSY
jgi:hypothetical protein